MVDPAWVALSLLKHVGSKTINALMHHFNYDPRAILAADAGELRRVPGVGPKIAGAIKAVDLTQAELAMRRWQEAGLRILVPDQPEYPSRLRPLDDRPPVLFAYGDWRSLPDRTAAIIGTRSPSPAAIGTAESLAFKLAERGFAIISGLAAGIDTAAHLGALAAPGGYTLAVLGCGVFNVYPPENRAVALAVQERGALVCEVHPFAAVNSASLVARNRIISGLSDYVIVVETGVDGGAMYAVRFARAQGRQVLVVDSGASGNQALIHAGARAIPMDLDGWEL